MFESLVDTPWAAIAAMAGVTLALRLGGYWLMGHVKLTARVSRGLEALPGCIFIAVALPLAARSGTAGMIATVVAVAVMALTSREIVALAAGMGAAGLLRALGI